MSETLLRFSVDRAEYLAVHDIAIAGPRGPSANWIEGMPIGNGDFGALVYGYPDCLTFALGKTDLWDGSDPGRSGYPPGTIADARKVFREHDEEGYRRLQQGDPGRPDLYENALHLLPAGVFRLHVTEAAVAVSCTQRLSLYDAISTTTYLPSSHREAFYRAAPVRVSSFVSRTDDVLVVRIEPGKHPLDLVSWELGRDAAESVPAPRPSLRRGVALYTQRLPGGGSFTVAVSAHGGRCRSFVAGRRLVGECVLDEATPLTLLLTIVSSRDAPETEGEALRRITAAGKRGYPRLLEDHRQWWRGFWGRSFACVADAAVEKWWYVSGYLCGSALRPGKQSPGLQGMWIKENRPAWNADYHGNINIQSLYWGLMGSNHLELMEPYFRYYTEILARCRRHTRRYFGTRGARLPHAGDIFGNELTSGIWVSLALSIAPSGWIAQLFWQYYEHTGDRAFLRDAAYPILRDVALFYSDYLQRDDRGRYVVSPSVHFERHCPSFASWGTNSSYDLATVHATLRMARSAAQMLGKDRDLQELWSQLIDGLSPIPVTQDGIWKAWEDRDPEYGFLVLLMFAVFPMELASAFHGPEELRRQAAETWKRLRVDFSGNYQTPQMSAAWCGGRGILEALRMGDVDWAMRWARWTEGDGVLPTGCVGGWDKHFFQVDHGPGMSRALSEMLLLTLGGVMRLFLGIPPAMPARFHSLRTTGAFLVSAEKRGEAVDYAIIQSLAGNSLAVANPFSTPARLREISSGRILWQGEEPKGHTISVATEQGGTYVLERLDRPLESIAQISITSASR